MGSFHQRTIAHRGATNVWWQSHQRQFSETEYASQDHSSPRLDGHGDYTCEDWRSRHPPEAAHVVLDRLRRSLSRKEYETLRPGIPHGSNDTEDDPGSANSNSWSERSRESWCKLLSNENHLDRPLTPISPGPLLFSNDLDQDIENHINQILENPVKKSPLAKNPCLEDRIIRYLRRAPSTFDLRNNTPDLGSEYDRDSDDERESRPEDSYRNASAPSRISSRTPSAEVLDGYVSLGGRQKSLVGATPDESSLPLRSRCQDPKPLPPLPPAGTTQFPYAYRAEILPERSLLRSPPLGARHEAPWAAPRSHIASQIRGPLPPESAGFPTSEPYMERPLPPEPFESSSSTSPTLLDRLRTHPAFRDQYEPSHLRYSSSGSGSSTCFSPLSSPISAYNPYRRNTRESGSSQSSQPLYGNRRHSHALSNSPQYSDSSIRHPSTTVSGFDPPLLSTLSYTRPGIHATLELERPDSAPTRRHSIEGQLSIGGTPLYADMALGMPQLRRRNTDESDRSDMQAHFQEIRHLVICNVERKLEEAEKSSQPLQNRSPSQPRSSSLCQRFGLKRLASDAQLIYSQRHMRSTPALVSNRTPAPVGENATFGSTLRRIRSANRSSSRSSSNRSSKRSSRRFSQEQSDVFKREDQSVMREPGIDDDADRTYRSRWRHMRKIPSLKSKTPDDRKSDSIPTDSVPTYPYKAAKVLGLLPEQAPAVNWKHRAKKADEMVECVRKFI